MSTARNADYDPDMALDLGGIVRAIFRSLFWLLPLIVLVCMGTLFVLQFVPSKYKGEARLLIESKESEIPGGSRGVEVERAVLDSEGVASQVQLLKSADLARKVVRKLDLASIEEFNADKSDKLFNRLLIEAGLDRQPLPSTVEERVLKHYYENLAIYRLEDSRVIAVEYSAEDPQLAALVANTILDEYIALQSSAKRETTEVAASSLEPQIAQLEDEVRVAQQAVEDFRAQADLLIGTDNVPLAQSQLAEISSEYSSAQASKAEAQAKADLIRELLNSGGSLETASEVLESPLIQRLRERQVAIQSNIAELSITLLPNHPQLRALNSQLSDYDRQIRSEARKVLQGLENNAKVASQQARALETRLNELKQEAAKSNDDLVRLSELQRVANAKASQLESVMAKFREADTRLRSQVLPADARIISRARVPVEAYTPKVFATTVIAALITFLLGCTLVLMREFLSGRAVRQVSYGGHRGARSSEPPEVVRQWIEEDERRDDRSRRRAPSREGASARDSAFAPTGYGFYSASNYDLSPQRGDRAESHVSDLKPQSEAAQDNGKLSGMAAALKAADEMMAAGPKPTRKKDEYVLPEGHEINGRYVVLSVDEPDVSHAVAFELARSAAMAGRSAVFVEVFPEDIDPDGAPGFSDLVAGEEVFSKVIYRDSKTNAHIIEAGTVPITDEMAKDERFGRALEALAKTHDVVVIDLGAIDGSQASANILGFAEQVIIGASSDEYAQDLSDAAKVLKLNTGNKVDILYQPKKASGRGRGPGYAA
ncbi:exopolysaccharide transport family protein [Roseibium sediminis]|uniref:exopolysaccharide transport family protein n=1 Tax=Roseibium sediminis TaxID=1775174 RepID=UPI00123D643B|nr:exopolysaccharide transport family protein [Roseibium sediminis]